MGTGYRFGWSRKSEPAPCQKTLSFEVGVSFGYDAIMLLARLRSSKSNVVDYRSTGIKGGSCPVRDIAIVPINVPLIQEAMLKLFLKLRNNGSQEHRIAPGNPEESGALAQRALS